MVAVQCDGPAKEMHRSVGDLAFFRGFAVRRVVIVVVDFKGVARPDVALEIHFVREHVDHLHDDARRNSRLHGRQIETRIDLGARAVIPGLEFFEYILRGEAAVGSPRDRDFVLDRR